MPQDLVADARLTDGGELPLENTVLAGIPYDRERYRTTVEIGKIARERVARGDRKFTPAERRALKASMGDDWTKERESIILEAMVAQEIRKERARTAEDLPA